MLGATILSTPAIPNRISLADVPPSTDPSHTQVFSSEEFAKTLQTQSPDCSVHDPRYKTSFEKSKVDGDWSIVVMVPSDCLSSFNTTMGAVIAMQKPDKLDIDADGNVKELLLNIENASGVALKIVKTARTDTSDVIIHPDGSLGGHPTTIARIIFLVDKTDIKNTKNNSGDYFYLGILSCSVVLIVGGLLAYRFLEVMRLFDTLYPDDSDYSTSQPPPVPLTRVEIQGIEVLLTKVQLAGLGSWFGLDKPDE